MRESISITIDLMASAAGAVMPEVVKVKCSNAVLSDEWLGSKLGGRRKWSQRYFVAAAGEAIAVENAGESSISSFVCPVARDPYIEVCLLVEINAPHLRGFGGLGRLSSWQPSAAHCEVV